MPAVSHKLRRRLALAVSLIALAAVGWWMSKQDAPKLPSDASGWAWLLAALGVYALGLAARGWRWHRIMRLGRVPHERADAYRLTLVGYMGNNVLPARGGELLRIGVLGSRTEAPRRSVLGSILAERVLDASVLAALFAILTWAGVAHRPAGEFPATIAAVALVLLGALLAVYLALRRRGRFERFSERIRPVARSLKIFAHAEGLLLGAISAAIWCAEGTTLLLVGNTLGLGLHLLDATLIIVLASLFAAIPAAPGYAGTFDAGLVLGLGAVGVTGGVAVGFILLARFVMFVPVTLAGLVVFMRHYGGFGRRVSRRADERPLAA